MPENLSFEIRRQVVHVILGTSIIILTLLIPSYISWILLFVIIITFSLSVLQLKFKLNFLYTLLFYFERKEYREKFPFKGALFYLIGCLLALKLFSFNTALASIAILTFGDSTSHIIGKIGNRKNPLNPEKNMEGTLMGILAGTLAGSFFAPFVLSLVASSIAMVFEALYFRLLEGVDDNITIPLISGTVIFLLNKFLMFSKT